MLGYIERLSSLGFYLNHDLAVDLILSGLTDSYSQFVMNYQMNKIETTIPELVNMLKTAETNVKKDHKAVLLVGPSKVKNNKKMVTGNATARFTWSR